LNPMPIQSIGFESMKVVQLGCGITGLVCAEQLAKNPDITELVLADYITDAAESLAKRIDNDKLSVVKVDAADHDSVKRLLTGADMVVSAIPGYFNRKVMEIAMETRTNYVDFSLPVGQWGEFDDLIDMCKDADVTILTSMGSDPGMSDIFARHAANKLDSVEQIRTMDGDSATAEGYDFFALWSPLELIEEITCPASVFKDGKMTSVPPLDKKQIYQFPEPVGPLPTYNTDHEETHLMSRFIKGVKNVDFRIAIDDDFALIANTLRKVGLSSLNPIDVKGKKVAPLEVVVALMPSPVDMIGKVKGFAAIVVETTGMKNGKKTMIKVWTLMSHEKAYELARSNATGYVVGTSGAVGAEMLAAGEITQKGLVVPEQIPPNKFIERLSKKNMEVAEETIEL